jgi:cobalt/nickel transport system permease protein
MIRSLFNIRLLEEVSSKNSPVHRVHPVIKFVVTVCYLIAVVSFDKYEISGLLPFVLYPVVLAAIANVPAWPVVKKILIMEPFIIGVGILNPLFDSHVIHVGAMQFSAGWLTFVSLCLKSALTLSAVLILLATTGIEKIGYAMRSIFVPRLFVLQFLLTYRYISVLAQEVSRTVTAYSLRSSGRKGLNRRVWGSLPGQILMRSIDRAERLYAAMCVRGFNGEYHSGVRAPLRCTDLLYFCAVISCIAAARLWNIPQLTGFYIMGVLQ